MVYNPATDFVGLWRIITGGVEKGEIPGLDFVVAALGRAGILNVVVSGTAPTANQATIAWFQPANPSYSAEGALYLWNADASTYQAATPALFYAFLVHSLGGSGASVWTGAGAPGNTLGVNGDLYIRTDAPGGIYGPKANGAWPAAAIIATSWETLSQGLDYAFGDTQGSVLYRDNGANGWRSLPPGGNGYLLASSGAGGNPQWVSPAQVLSSSAFDSAFGAAEGDMIYRGPSVWQALAIGSNGMFLAVSGGLPAWETISNALDTAFGSPAQGAIIYRGAAGWTTLAAGTAGNLLQTNGAGNNPSWASPPSQALTSGQFDTLFGATQGSIIYRSGTGWTALAPGSAGDLLQTNGAGANPSWVAPAASGISALANLGGLYSVASITSTGAVSPGGSVTATDTGPTALFYATNIGGGQPAPGNQVATGTTWLCLGAVDTFNDSGAGVTYLTNLMIRTG